MLDERVKVWHGEAIARPLLATTHIDVAEFAILHEGGDLIVGDAEIGCRLVDRQQPGESPCCMSSFAGPDAGVISHCPRPSKATNQLIGLTDQDTERPGDGVNLKARDLQSGIDSALQQSFGFATFVA